VVGVGIADAYHLTISYLLVIPDAKVTISPNEERNLEHMILTFKSYVYQYRYFDLF